MKRLIWAVVAAGAVLLIWSGESVAYTEGESITLVVPMTAFETESGGWFGKKYIAKVGLDGGGRLILNGDDGWRTLALPTVLEGSVTKIKNEKKERLTRLVVTARMQGYGSGYRIIFEIPDGIGDWQRALEEIAITAESSDDSEGNEINDRLTPFYRFYCPIAFTGSLESLPEEKQMALVRAIHAGAPRCSISTESFKGEPFLAVDLGLGPNLYNTLQVNQNQRLAREMTDRIFPVLKTIAEVADPEDPFGMNFLIKVASKDFLKESAAPEIDEVSVFVSLQDALQFAEFEITDQELADNSVIIVNENRVKVLLTEQ